MKKMMLFAALTWAMIAGLSWVSNAHDGGAIHNRAQEFSFDYNAQYDVYCGWRHSYEGISCVKVGFLSTLVVGD